MNPIDSSDLYVNYMAIFGPPPQKKRHRGYSIKYNYLISHDCESTAKSKFLSNIFTMWLYIYGPT